MESILVNLISDVFSIAGNFYDDLQSVPLTIDELKQAFERAGIIVSEKSIEEITLHLENLNSLTIQHKREERVAIEKELELERDREFDRIAELGYEAMKEEDERIAAEMEAIENGWN